MVAWVNKALSRRMLASVALAALAAGAAGSRADVSSQEVKNAVAKGIAHIRQHQNLGNGQWPDAGHHGGVTALCVLAMLNAGVPPADIAASRGLESLAALQTNVTYVVSLKAQAFAAAYAAAKSDDPKLDTYYREARRAAGALAEGQLDVGMWTYTCGRGGRGGRGDNSNTQFALLGLHEAASLQARPPHKPIDIPDEVWKRSRRHFENTQVRNGSWGYTGNAQGYGSMTTAGLASLYICGLRLNVGGKKQFIDGAYPDCGRYTQNVVLAKGLEWLADNFSVRTNPGGGAGWHFYYLYGLERVGMISGKRNLGDHDWYREGAAYLVAAQRGDGGWGGPLYDSAFSVLFLAKGNRPVLIQKVQWSGRWNRNIHDLENLAAFLGDKLSERVTWQTTTLAPSVEQLRVSPILMVTGHEFPKFTDDEKAKLRAYVKSGGTIIFEACCGSRPFAEGFRAFAREVWPEYPLRNLPAVGAERHPVWDCYYRYEQDFQPFAAQIGDNYGLQGIDAGCRTSVFFSPRALSCLWELGDIPRWSEFAFRLGTNIAAYATGREKLANKLDVIELPSDKAPADRRAEVPRGAVRVARLIHDGDYNCDPLFETNLAALLRDKAKVDVVAKARHLRADDKQLFEYPVVFLTGHHSFKLSGKEIDALRLYLKRGGVLLADACCGKEAFDRSFREMTAELYPPGTKDSSGQVVALTPLAKDHPILSGAAGAKLGELRYRSILAEELKRAGAAHWRGTEHPPVEAVRLDDRCVILYSRYDFSCALEGDRPYSCRGYQDEDGKKLAINLFLYAISY